jgi:hypothetical protein
VSLHKGTILKGMLPKLKSCKYILVYRSSFGTFWYTLVHDNFQFNTIWHTRSVAALTLCWRVAESDVPVTPSVTCMDWLCWWYNHVAHVVPPSAVLAFVAKISEKCKSTSPSAIQMKNLYWREIRRNKPTWKRWTNCWHLPLC